MTVDCQGVRDDAYYYQTTDGGRTWQETPLPPPGNRPNLYQEAFCGLKTAQLFSPERGVIGLSCTSREVDGGKDVFLYNTQDQGQSWQTSPYPGGNLLFLDPENGWALSREIHKTSDRGETWEFIKIVNWDGDFQFLDQQYGFAVARSELGEIVLVKTTDGGSTWEILETKLQR